MAHLIQSFGELPRLSIVYNAEGFSPVVINLPDNWEETGECRISYMMLRDLIETCRLLTFIVDAAADEVFAEEKALGLHAPKKDADIPF